MDKAIFSRFKSVADTQLDPQKRDFAVTKLVTVLIFGIFCPRGPEEATIRLPGTVRLFGNRCPMAPGAFHTAYGRGKPGREVKRPLNSLRTIVAMLGGIEIAHQERSQERVTRTHGVLHVCHGLGMLPIVTLAVIGNAALSASRCGHKTWAKPFTQARRSRISSSLAASAALKNAKST